MNYTGKFIDIDPKHANTLSYYLSTSSSSIVKPSYILYDQTAKASVSGENLIFTVNATATDVSITGH